MFPRSRWTGAPNTFRDIGLPENVNALEYEVAKRFRRSFGEAEVVIDGSGAAAGPRGHDGHGPAPLEDVPADRAEPDDDRRVSAPLPAEADSEQAMQEEARKNKAYRTNCLKWLQCGPGVLLTITQVCSTK